MVLHVFENKEIMLMLGMVKKLYVNACDDDTLHAG